MSGTSLEDTPRDTARERPRQRVLEIVRSQPEDASLDEILRELAFHRLILRGLDDLRDGRILSSASFHDRARRWLDE